MLSRGRELKELLSRGLPEAVEQGGADRVVERGVQEFVKCGPFAGVGVGGGSGGAVDQRGAGVVVLGMGGLLLQEAGLTYFL